MKIVHPDTYEPLPERHVGELLIRGTSVTPGYYKRPDATAALFRDGWLCTGDGGYLDAEGYLFLTDRIKDMIVTGAENVYPIEVEDVLFQHPAVAECAVIGVPHEKWGETVKALVVAREGQNVDEADLIEFCRGRMAHYKCPTSIEFRDALARTATGKLQKFKLRSPYWEGLDRQVN